ncbi:hypothetical protein AB0K48_07220, partial [Nonomuraea sp. NPDC055795]
MGRARPSRWPFGATQGSHERLLGHLDELRRVPQGGGPDGDFRERLRTRLTSADADGAAAAAPAVPEAQAPPGRARHARRTRRV